MTNKQAQITINAIKFMLDHAQYSDDVEEALNMAINALTTQQETHDKRIETHACDCVSRQAAIEVIDAVFPVDPMKSEYAQGIACGAALAKTYVEQLPPAQPEIIRCKDCKFASGDRRNDG